MFKRKYGIIALIVILALALGVGSVIYYRNRDESFPTEGLTPLEIEYYREMTPRERERAIRIAVIDSEVPGETWVHVIKDGVEGDDVYILKLGKEVHMPGGASPGEELIIVAAEPFDPADPIIVAEKVFWIVIF